MVSIELSGYLGTRRDDVASLTLVLNDACEMMPSTSRCSLFSNPIHCRSLTPTPPTAARLEVCFASSGQYAGNAQARPSRVHLVSEQTINSDKVAREHFSRHATHDHDRYRSPSPSFDVVKANSRMRSLPHPLTSAPRSKRSSIARAANGSVASSRPLSRSPWCWGLIRSFTMPVSLEVSGHSPLVCSSPLTISSTSAPTHGLAIALRICTTGVQCGCLSCFVPMEDSI